MFVSKEQADNNEPRHAPVWTNQQMSKDIPFH